MFCNIPVFSSSNLELYCNTPDMKHCVKKFSNSVRESMGIVFNSAVFTTQRILARQTLPVNKSQSYCKKMKFSVKDILSKCKQIGRKLRTCSYLLENI